MNCRSALHFFSRFCKANMDNATSPKWVWKKPYTTNQVYNGNTSIEDVINEFKSLKQQWQAMIPYVFLQVYLQNRMEYNVVCLNGIALYEAKIAQRSVVKIGKVPFSNSCTRKLFAENAIKALVSNRPESLVSGLFRVDIMWCTYLNKMIVIEFESLEAAHYSNPRDNAIEAQLSTYLAVYQANNIIMCLNNILKKNIPLLHYPNVDISSQYSI